MADSPTLGARISYYAVEVIGSALLAYFFIIVMMTASGQQRVNAILADQNAQPANKEKIDYSTAWARLQTADNAKDQLQRDTDKEGKDAATYARDVEQLEAKQAAAETAWNPVRGLLGELGAYPSCGGADPNAPNMQGPAGTYNLMQAREQIWRSLGNCVGGLPPAIAQDVTKVLRQPANFGAAFDDWQPLSDRADRELSADKRDLTAIDHDTANIQAGSAYETDFADMSILRQSPLPLTDAFIGVPPSMIQFIIAFLAGGFGALLVTLVLVVYPKSGYTASAPGEYGARVILGALISVSVYIFLGGGSAILGNSFSLNESQTNYMTFAAVGILAGMFSDRVAGWMSDRAGTFFSAQTGASVSSSLGQLSGVSFTGVSNSLSGVSSSLASASTASTGRASSSTAAGASTGAASASLAGRVSGAQQVAGGR